MNSRTATLAPVALALTVLLSTAAAARPYAPADGAWSVLFSISNDFQLSSFQGSAVSLKHHFTSQSAVRLGVSGSILRNDTDQRRDDVTQPPATMTTESRSSSLTLSLLYVRYPADAAPVLLYWGAGPVGGFTRQDDLQVSVLDTESRSNSIEERGWHLGARALLGVESLVTEWLGIHAEYSVEGTYRRVDRTQTDLEPDGTERTYTADQRSWHVNARGVLFGLSAYF